MSLNIKTFSSSFYIVPKDPKWRDEKLSKNPHIFMEYSYLSFSSEASSESLLYLQCF